MKNLAVALHAGKAVQCNEITTFFADEGWAYWHWIDDFWIVQVPDSYTPHTLHTQIEQLPNSGSPVILVFEFQGRIKFWGKCDPDAWKWLNNIGNPS
jgi:hypothetical protein